MYMGLWNALRLRYTKPCIIQVKRNPNATMLSNYKIKRKRNDMVTLVWRGWIFICRLITPASL